jgi:hypothetical protein
METQAQSPATSIVKRQADEIGPVTGGTGVASSAEGGENCPHSDVEVVQNDSQVAIATTVSSVRRHLEQLVAERQAWEDAAYRTSNEQLYLLLQKCYATYKAMSGNSPQAIALREGLTDYVNLSGLKFNSSTHTLVKIVKCVFGSDRRRTSAYGIVLRAALARNVAVADVPAFIRGGGGIEEIRLSKSPNAVTTKQKAAVAAEAVQEDHLGVFTCKELGEKLDAGKIGKPVVLIGTWQADGSVIVRGVVQNGTAVTAALAGYYTANKEAAKAHAEQRDAANDEQIKQNAVNAAVNAALMNA